MTAAEGPSAGWAGRLEAAAGRCQRVSLTGVVSVPVPPERALRLFTPTGERSWADDWDPAFAEAEPDEAAPGTVFWTGHHGRPGYWIVLRHEPARAIAYALTVPGDRAGLITVDCAPAPAGTAATVSYEMTALVPGANHALAAFAAGYREYLAEWAEAIAAALSAGRALPCRSRRPASPPAPGPWRSASS